LDDETDEDESEDDDDVLFELDDDEVDVVVGVALVDEGGGGATDDGASGAGPPSEPSTLKTTMLAVLPLGTVTTQKLAPPTPVALTGLFTPFVPSVEGWMAQGRPLHPPPGHSILMPKFGGVSLSEQPTNMGFHAILT